jgi:hypothetical protein
MLPLFDLAICLSSKRTFNRSFDHVRILTRSSTITDCDCLQQHISMLNMFDAIQVNSTNKIKTNKCTCLQSSCYLFLVQTAHIYDSIEDFNEQQKNLLGNFCHVSVVHEKVIIETMCVSILVQGKKKVYRANRAFLLTVSNENICLNIAHVD